MSPEEFTRNLWRNNPVFVQLLGLSPLLAISKTATEGLALGLLTAITAITAVHINQALCRYVRPSLRYLWIVFLLASLVTLIEILMQSFRLALHQELGIYVPLVACNLALLIHVESNSDSTQSVFNLKITLKAIAYAIAIAAAFTLFSLIRELIAFGSMFRHWHLISGSETLAPDVVSYSSSNQALHFALLQPGAFILLGVLIAFLNWLKSILPRVNETKANPAEKIMRARVTGKL